MKGKHHIRIQNRKIQYEFDVKRNITIIRGDSATGKTTLIDMLSQYETDREHSGIELVCDKNCTVITGRRWQENIRITHDSIVFNEVYLHDKEKKAIITAMDRIGETIVRKIRSLDSDGSEE